MGRWEAMGGDAARNDSRVHAKVDNQQASYSGVGQIINGPVTTQVTGQANRTTYTVPPEEQGAVAAISQFLHRYIGDRLALQISWIITVLGAASLAPLTLERPAMLVENAVSLFWTGVILIVAGVATRRALAYKADRTCQECGSHYTLEERSDAQVEDITVKEGVRRKKTRFLACVNCGFEEDRVTRRLIED